ncbi:PDGLE domain-containing protein [Actinomycetospora soli]|uniref:PDGLE domain-containing protein n=1 Tax=Actinomycetospora soli TaxID=2893887 RepID=UPI001E4C4631|nr:PDGLE domain-containing protein [Actinomycetospora soli]MCD2188762.1 PDGLE domain-containing protein [Actinomycetospora soli]
MSTATTNRRYAGFLGAFLLVALLLAGGASYLASSSPDGLDAVTQTGCSETDAGLQGQCIAQNAGEHPAAGSPFADYAVGGDEAFTGVAGVIGVIATLAVAGALFWLLRRRSGP